MRLKDVEPIIRELQDEEQYGADYFLPIELLKAAPTIEAKPIVHAHWKSTDKADHKPCRIKNPEKWVLCECSACGHKNGMRRNYKFCPYCGATMDESISCPHEDDNNTQKVSVDDMEGE